MRRLVTFPCLGETLAGTLDAAPGTTGLLIVSGGNELRIGAHRGMALLAAAIAAAGYPVLRFDRRGLGDSTGRNEGFRTSAPDIAAAAAFLREQTGVTRMVAFGNCDAATALALFHQRAGIDGLLLANPWVIEGESDLPPPAAIRARYAERLRDPRQWLRLASGGVNIGKLVKGLATSVKSSSESSSLANDMAAALASSSAPTMILLADRDNTAIAFQKALQRPAFAAAYAKASIAVRETASHSFAREGDADWVLEKVIEALTRS